MDDLLSLPPECMPRHIAIIMDGNGRWARKQNQPRVYGHQHGAISVRRIVTECGRLYKERSRPSHLTLYSFSTENWKRPPEEVKYLMEMYIEHLHKELPTLVENNIRFNQIGRMEGLPVEVLTAIKYVKDQTANNTGITLNLAVNYGSRAELVDAMRQIAQSVKAGKLDPGSITEETISASIYTAGQPDPDLMIRTAGEMRISNFLLWQISYAELYVTDTLWPDFDIPDLHAAIKDFAGRNRRFGAL